MRQYYIYLKKRIEQLFKSLQNLKIKLDGKSVADRGVLLLQLRDDGRVVPFARHQQPKHLLSVFGHDELYCRLVFF